MQLPGGLFLQYHGLKADLHDSGKLANAQYLTRYGMNKLYGGLLTENVVQALARRIIAEQMLQVADKYRVVTMTHDEIVAIAPKKQSDQCLNDMLKIMATPPAWAPGLPLFAEGGYDACYSK
jgi:hypothetical protein